jgi:thiamine-monophosphate kinase
MTRNDTKQGEFDLIDHYFARHRENRADVSLGIGDDAALLSVPQGQSLVVTVDTLVAGVHFPLQTTAAAIGHKALAVNLSDLAAMGATPAWLTLALTLPQADDTWLSEFAQGFFALADEFNVQLVGGDTTRGPLSISVQALGWVPEGEALTRSGARPGDVILVTGTLGDAGGGLQLRQGQAQVAEAQAEVLLQRLDRPTPRLAAGQALRGLASATIDISDGLGADLGHILDASGAGAEVLVDALPLSPALQALGRDTACQLAATSGDDYELCFTVAADRVEEARARLAAIDCPCTRIGTISSEPGLHWRGADGQPWQPAAAGFDHFAVSQETGGTTT